MSLDTMNAKPATQMAPKKPLESALDEARKLAISIGLDWDKLSTEFKKKFEKIHLWGHLEDSASMNELAMKILEDPNVALLCVDESKEQDMLKNITQGSTLSDIGKSGPKEATVEQSDLIVEIFKIRNVENREHTKISDFVRNRLDHFKTPEERARILVSLETHGVNPDMSMLEFYNLHTEWSSEIAQEESAISPKVKKIVACHHALDRKNCTVEELTLENKLVILLDNYDASRTRSGRTHEQAIAWIREKITANGLGEDKEFKTLIEALEKIAPSIKAYE